MAGGDLLVTVDGKTVNDPDDVAEAIADDKPGETVEVDTVTAPDPKTVVVALKNTRPSFLQDVAGTFGMGIVPKHIWEGRSEEEVMSGDNKDPVGSGPYLYETHDQDRMVWKKNDKWWGRETLDLDVKPKYIVDIVNSSNEAALGQLLQGDIDLSNNFLPGIATLVKGGYQVQTYFPEPPYMLSANTAWLASSHVTYRACIRSSRWSRRCSSRRLRRWSPPRPECRCAG